MVGWKNSKGKQSFECILEKTSLAFIGMTEINSSLKESHDFEAYVSSINSL